MSEVQVQALIQVLIVAAVANVILFGGVAVGRWLRRRRASSAVGSGAMPAFAGGPALAAVAEGAPVSFALPEPPVPAQPPQFITVGGPMSVDTAPTPEESDTRPAVGGTPFIGGVTTFIDLETGLETAFAWDEIVRNEDARYARYGRPAAVVVAELDRLDALAERFGQSVADRLIPPVAATLRRQSRRSDRIARVGHARFCVLLSETDEVRAINYVDRVRDACDVWLESAAVSVRLVVGWASAGPAGTVADAVRIAEQRMYADRLPGGSRRSVAAPVDVAPTPEPAPAPEPAAPAPTPVAPVAVAPESATHAPVAPPPAPEPAAPATPTAVYVQPPTASTAPIAAPDQWPPTTSAAPYAFGDAPAATPDDAPGGEDEDALRHD